MGRDAALPLACFGGRVSRTGTYNLYCVFLENVIAHKIVVDISTKISVFRPPDFKQGLKINDCLNVCQGGPLASANAVVLTLYKYSQNLCLRSKYVHKQLFSYIFYVNQSRVLGKKLNCFQKL